MGLRRGDCRREEELRSGMERGFCTGRDDVTPALTGQHQASSGLGEQRVCATAGGGMAKMQNTYAPPRKLLETGRQRHRVRGTDVPKKTFFSVISLKNFF